MSIILNMISIKNIITLSKHTDLTESLALSHDEQVLMSAGRDGNLLCWDTISHDIIHSWCPYNGFELYHADMSGNSRFALACFGQYKEIHVIDMTTKQSFFVPLLEHCTFPLFGVDNSIISFTKNLVYKIDITGHNGINFIFRADSRINTFQISRSRKNIIISTRKNTIHLLDALSGFPRAVIPKKYSKIAFISVSDDDSWLVIGDKQANCIDVWRLCMDKSQVLLTLVASHSSVHKWCENIFECEYFNLVSQDNAYVCGTLTPLIYIDFTHQKAQVIDKEIGYVASIAINKNMKKIYIPLTSESLGTLGIVSYT